MEPSQQPLIFVLTDEIWGTIFGFVRGIYQTFTNEDKLKANLQRQQQLLDLRLVCKQFSVNQISHMQRLTLGQDFDSRALPSLFAWLRQRKRSLKFLECSCSIRESNLVLSTLAVSSAHLRAAHLQHCDLCSLQLLSAFTNLTACALGVEYHANLGLLHSLPQLSRLQLTGCPDAKITSLHKLQHLRHVSLRQVEIIGLEYIDLAALESLSFFKVKSDDSWDTFVCTGLTVLAFDDAMFPDGRKIDGLEQLSCLARLKSLIISSTHDPSWLRDLKFSVLATLEILIIGFQGVTHPNLARILQLTKLSELSLYSSLPTTSAVSTVNLNVEWHRLKALQHLVVKECKVQLRSEYAIKLLQLKKLSRVVFRNVTPDNRQATTAFVLLAYKFASLRPEVDFQWIDTGLGPT